MTDALLAAWQATSWLEVVSVVFGLIYVVLAARENPWCWPAAMIGTATAILLFWDVSLVMESALNVFYLAMAFYGLWAWHRGGQGGSALAISSWGLNRHLIVLAVIAVLTLASGTLLSSNTSASYPFIDSFTTWSAVITTWMVTRKVLQNWVYWFFINTVSVWLFYQKELFLYALLFVLYVAISIYGYLNWRQLYASLNASHYVNKENATG